MLKAYDYCASTDEDGDGLMDNTKAGAGAVETGALRRRDVLTDVYLGTVWTEAAGAMRDLARIADPAFAATAQAAAEKARASINRRFPDNANRRINFAIMKDGKGQAEQTVWPAFGIWRGVFDLAQPAVEGMLDQLARAGLGTDWGARMLSNESALYEPLSYNNGATWPFLTGWAALALYTGGRGAAAWQYLDALADLTFLEARGYMPELLSGDLLRAVDAAVPHQLFATTGFVSTAMRGMVGLQEADNGLRLSPQLPPGWSFLRVKNLRWRDARGTLEIRRAADGSLAYSVTSTKGTLPVELTPVLPPGAQKQPAAPARARAAAGPAVTASAGIDLVPEQAPLTLGDAPQRLRIVDTRVDGGVYRARLQGLKGRTYRVRLDVPFAVAAIEGGREVARDGRVRTIDIVIPSGPAEWVDCQLVVRLGARLK
jgi:hypothetical protein